MPAWHQHGRPKPLAPACLLPSPRARSAWRGGVGGGGCRLLNARKLAQNRRNREDFAMIDPIRRNILATGAAATAVAAAPQVFAQSLAQGGAKMSFYERGPVRIRYTEAGAGVPLLVIPGGGLNSTIANLTAANSPFDPIAEFKNEYRVIAA